MATNSVKEPPAEGPAQQFARGIHGEQRMVLRWQFTQSRAARRVDEGEMGVAPWGPIAVRLALEPAGPVSTAASIVDPTWWGHPG